MVDEDELATRVRVEHLLQRRRVVRLPVAFRALVAHAHNLTRREVRVLRVRLPEDAARAVKQGAGLGGGGDVALGEGAALRGAGVDVPLSPGGDRRSAGGPSEDARAVGNGHRSGDVREVDVIEDEGSAEGAVRRGRGANEDGRA